MPVATIDGILALFELLFADLLVAVAEPAYEGHKITPTEVYLRDRRTAVDAAGSCTW
jgi:hypothetical protein